MSHTTGAANAWSVIAADSARDLVFVPTGTASPDYYGGERVGVDAFRLVAVITGRNHDHDPGIHRPAHGGEQGGARR